MHLSFHPLFTFFMEGIAMKHNETPQETGSVNIKPVNLNVLPQESDSSEIVKSKIAEDTKSFSDEVYSNLPELLQVPCSMFSDKNDKATFLVGVLGLASGIIPNIMGMYFTEEVKPNLYCYILGNYSIGKGAIKLARKLILPIHEHLKAESKQASTDFKREFSHYIKLKKQFENNEIETCPEEPKEPPKQRLFLPANISGTGFKQALNENGGRGIIFETEGDTLANILKQDYGNYSDDLRRAFHHETIAYCRRTGNEDVEINDPCLSVVISSTYDQLFKLIPSVENGLFSRFNYFEIPPNHIFNDPFSDGDKALLKLFEEYSEHYFTLWKKLQALDNPIVFKLKEEQEKEFVEIFQGWKNEISQNVSPHLEGYINRLGNICFRICMLLSALRLHKNDVLPTQIVCTKQDFDNAFRIVDVFKWQAVNVYLHLPPPSNPTSSNHSIEEQEKAIELKKKCLELHSQGFSIGAIAKQVYGSLNHKSKVWRTINRT